jgi:hypothetical protein
MCAFVWIYGFQAGRRGGGGRWLHRFLERHGICHRIINGEKGDEPKDVTASWKEEQLGVIHQYRDEDVYKADETA